MDVNDHLEDIYNSSARNLCCWIQDIKQSKL